MKKMNTRHVATRRPITAADPTALATVRGGKLVRISSDDPPPVATGLPMDVG